MTADPAQPGILFERCAQWLRQRDKRAAALLPQLEEFAGYGAGWLLLGEALLDANQCEAALVAFRRVGKADPASTPALLAQSAAYVALGQPEAASAAYAEAERHAPGAKDHPYRLGIYLRSVRRPEAAQAAFVRAVTLDPGFVAAWFALGLVRQDLHDHPGAVTAYAAALTADPALHEAAFNLGVALQETGALEKALDAYAMAYRLRPAALGRIAHALTSSRTGCLWLSLDALGGALIGRPPPELLAIHTRAGQ